MKVAAAVKVQMSVEVDDLVWQGPVEGFQRTVPTHGKSEQAAGNKNTRGHVEETCVAESKGMGASRMIWLANGGQIIPAIFGAQQPVLFGSRHR